MTLSHPSVGRSDGAVLDGRRHGHQPGDGGYGLHGGKQRDADHHAGATSSTLTISTIEDEIDEPNETFVVELSNPSSNAELGSRGHGDGNDRGRRGDAGR